MLPFYVALVSEIKKISASELTRVAAGLQKQVMRDFGPIWSVQADVSAFITLDDVPLGYWPIMVRDDIGVPGAGGVHLDKDGQPFALVRFSNDWSLTASHECLEMLADPFGNRLVAGQSPRRGQGRVEFLVEVCDPSEAPQFAYQVNGVVVSDFYTPAYFDPLRASGVRYSFTGAIPGPREVLRGGYLSWHDPVTDHWFQLTFFGAQKRFRDLGILGQLTESLRATIDQLTPVTERVSGPDPKEAVLVAAQTTQKAIAKSTNAKADSWREQIEALKSRSPS